MQVPCVIFFLILSSPTNLAAVGPVAAPRGLPPQEPQPAPPLRRPSAELVKAIMRMATAVHVFGKSLPCSIIAASRIALPLVDVIFLQEEQESAAGSPCSLMRPVPRATNGREIGW